MKKTIYIIRHGETDYNKANLVQGSAIDAPLNDKGKAQADAFWEMYKEMPFEKIYTTELKRTHQTADGFIAKGISWQVLAGFNEMFYGDHEGQPIDDAGSDGVDATKLEWKAGNCSVKMKGGESPIDVQERQMTDMKEIIKGGEELVLLAMHGRALRILLCWTLGKSLKEMDTFPMLNSCLYVLEYDYENETFECVKYGSIEHLDKAGI